jgi:cell division septum initiation protein DivIVA
MLLFLIALPVFAQTSTRVENPMVDALIQGDVYVASELAGVVDEARLQQVAQQLRPFAVKFVVVPLSNKQSRERLAHGLRNALNIREGAVIVLVPQAPGLHGGVSISSDVIPGQQATQVFQQYRTVFSSQGYTQGLEQLARALRDHYVSERRSSTLGTVALFGIPAVLVLGGMAWVIRRRAQEVARLKARLQGLRAQVLEGIEYLDGYIDVLPEGEDASRAREHRQKAAELQALAVQRMESAKRPEDLWRAEHLLDEAQRSIEKAKKYILRAGGDTSIRIEEEPEEPVAGEDMAQIRPNDRTYACFFCSKPPTLSTLQPVEVTIGEQTRKVWACEECAEQLRRGETPAMRVFRDGDRTRPWYEVPDYDPYRDYGRPYPGMDWVSLLLLGSILSHPAPVIIHEHEPVNVGGENPEVDAGGGDFFDSTFGESATTGNVNTGGGDFFDNMFGWGETSDTDAGGGDFFSDLFDGFDAGDVDAGGGDFADCGGDFGGDFGGGDF